MLREQGLVVACWSQAAALHPAYLPARWPAPLRAWGPAMAMARSRARQGWGAACRGELLFSMNQLGGPQDASRTCERLYGRCDALLLAPAGGHRLRHVPPYLPGTWALYVSGRICRPHSTINCSPCAYFASCVAAFKKLMPPRFRKSKANVSLSFVLLHPRAAPLRKFLR